jgi:hypothetical protein
VVQTAGDERNGWATTQGEHLSLRTAAQCTTVYPPSSQLLTALAKPRVFLLQVLSQGTDVHSIWGRRSLPRIKQETGEWIVKIFSMERISDEWLQPYLSDGTARSSNGYFLAVKIPTILHMPRRRHMYNRDMRSMYARRLISIPTWGIRL